MDRSIGLFSGLGVVLARISDLHLANGRSRGGEYLRTYYYICLRVLLRKSIRYMYYFPGSAYHTLAFYGPVLMIFA